MKKVFFIILFTALILASCSLIDDSSNNLTLKVTDTSTQKDGINAQITAGVEELAFGYVDNNDTVWVSVPTDHDSFTLRLKSNDTLNLCGDTLNIAENHVFQFFKLVVSPPKIKLEDTLDIDVNCEAEGLTLFYEFAGGLDLSNGHIDLIVDFHSDKWLQSVIIPGNMIEGDSISGSITCEIEG